MNDAVRLLGDVKRASQMSPNQTTERFLKQFIVFEIQKGNVDIHLAVFFRLSLRQRMHVQDAVRMLSVPGIVDHKTCFTAKRENCCLPLIGFLVRAIHIPLLTSLLRHYYFPLCLPRTKIFAKDPYHYEISLA